MFVPALVFVAGALLSWLSYVDRTSAVAIAVVEMESQFGFPVGPLFMTAGAVLAIARVWHRHAKVPAPARPLTRDAARTQAPRPSAPGQPAAPGGRSIEDPGSNWLTTVRASARGVSDDPMGRVRFDAAQGVPIALVLTAVTREQARRRVSAYAAWLATIPTPPTARVHVVSSPDLEGPLHGVFRGELAKHFPAEAFHVTSTHEGADALFTWPDPRWSA